MDDSWLPTDEVSRQRCALKLSWERRERLFVQWLWDLKKLAQRGRREREERCVLLWQVSLSSSSSSSNVCVCHSFRGGGGDVGHLYLRMRIENNKYSSTFFEAFWSCCWAQFRLRREETSSSPLPSPLLSVRCPVLCCAVQLTTKSYRSIASTHDYKNRLFFLLSFSLALEGGKGRNCNWWQSGSGWLKEAKRQRGK